MPFALEQLTQGLAIAAVINPQSITNTSVNSGNGIDMSKFRRALAIITFGTNAGSVIGKLQAATTSGGAFTDVPGAALAAITTGSKQATIEVRDDELQSLVGAGYQWLRVVLTEGNVGAALVSAVLLAGEGDWKPVNKQNPASVVQQIVV